MSMGAAQSSPKTAAYAAAKPTRASVIAIFSTGSMHALSVRRSTAAPHEGLVVAG
jgi:hypothetical protein